MESLKEIINNVFDVDINVVSRKREVSDARKVYSKILRDLKYTCESIGDSINRDHSTITHYMSDINFILEQDKSLNEKYIYCREKFLENNPDLVVVRRRKKFLIGSEFQLKKDLDGFIDKMEQYEIENGSMPSIEYCKTEILPLFNR